MTDYNFKEAYQNLAKVDCDISAMEWFEEYANDIDITKNPVLAALHIADQLQRGEVTGEVYIAGAEVCGDHLINKITPCPESIFKAMAEQLIKERKESE